MDAALLSAQLLLACLVAWVVAERAHLLWYVAPASPRLAAAWVRALEAQDVERARSLALAVPRCWGSRVVAAAFEAAKERRAAEVEWVLAELRAEAGARLGFVRTAATLGSTLGLFGGILAMQRGHTASGLLVLQAGLPEALALGEALQHMALGMGTAAFCLVAFAALRRAARDLVDQARQIAEHVLRVDASAWAPGMTEP